MTDLLLAIGLVCTSVALVIHLISHLLAGSDEGHGYCDECEQPDGQVSE